MHLFHIRSQLKYACFLLSDEFFGLVNLGASQFFLLDQLSLFFVEVLYLLGVGSVESVDVIVFVDIYVKQLSVKLKLQSLLVDLKLLSQALDLVDILLFLSFKSI